MHTRNRVTKYIRALDFIDKKTRRRYEMPPKLAAEFHVSKSSVRRRIIEAVYRGPLWSLRSRRTLVLEVKRQIDMERFEKGISLDASGYSNVEFLKIIDWDRISRILGRPPSSCEREWKSIIRVEACPHRREMFSSEEKKVLLASVEKLGKREWKKVAEIVGVSLSELTCSYHSYIDYRENNRTPLECFRNYIQHLNRIPEVRKSRLWSKEEDIKLIEGVASCGNHKWSKVSMAFDRRTPGQCLHRWRVLTKQKRGRWTKEEDVLLMEAINKYGKHNWAAVEKLIPGRDGSQCRERYTNCLDESIRKGPWSNEEKCKLKELVEKYGPGNWSFIASQMKNRTDSSVNRKYKHMCRTGFISEQSNETGY